MPRRLFREGVTFGAGGLARPQPPRACVCSSLNLTRGQIGGGFCPARIGLHRKSQLETPQAGSAARWALKGASFPFLFPFLFPSLSNPPPHGVPLCPFNASLLLSHIASCSLATPGDAATCFLFISSPFPCAKMALRCPAQSAASLLAHAPPLLPAPPLPSP